MSRVIYVNGRYLAYAQAGVHAEDRGFQFGDAVYEVIPVQSGRLVDEGRHIDRLERSLRELAMRSPMRRRALQLVMRETLRRNRVRNGTLYLQVSRGEGPRDFVFPHADTPPTVVCIARAGSWEKLEAQAAAGIAVITHPDERWARVDIKTVQLLPAALAKQAAKAAGAKEAWLVDRDGFVTEGASSNAWIVTADGALKTRSADSGILRGVTRSVVMEVVAREGFRLVEEPFTVAEARAAKEAFVTSASNFVMPVVKIDGRPVGTGKPGRLSLTLRRLFSTAAEYAE